MITKANPLSIFFLISMVSGCSSQEKPEDFDYGKVENNKYINTYFGCEMTLPADWVVQTKAEMDRLTKAGGELVAGDDEKLKAVIKASEVNTAVLLGAFQFERGSPVEYNPSITVVAENIRNFPGVKTGSDYLFQARKLLQQSQLKYDSIDSEFAKEVINGTDFYKMNADIKYMGQHIRQIYYSTVLNGFSLNMIISYVNDEQKQTLLKSVNSMKFKK